MFGKVRVKDIAAAIQEIKTGAPRTTAPGAMTWCIQFQEIAYPANHVLALAVKSATGQTLVSNTRKDSKEIIKALEKLLDKEFKFKVVFRQAGRTRGG
jgi:hypothetical protein